MPFESPSSPPPAAGQRQALGTFFRDLLACVEKGGWMPQVRERVSPATRQAMDDPPWQLAWVGSAAIDDIEQAVGAVAGRAALVELGLQTARAQAGSLLRPLLRTVLKLFAQDPAGVFARLNWFYGVAVRGIDLKYRPAGPDAGVVEARFEGLEVPDAAYHVMEGSLRLVFELCGVRGSVGERELKYIEPTHSVVWYAVTW